MSSAPQGYSTIGPIYEKTLIKDKFIDVCKVENKTMEKKLKELIKTAITSTFPEYAFPEDMNV